MEQNDLIPITAAVAVAIFLTKEIIETVRKFTANRRKIRTIKALLSEECERNHFTITRFTNQIAEIEGAKASESTLIIDRNVDGKKRFVVKRDSGGGSTPVPAVWHQQIEKYLYEAASLDRKLFESMNDAYAQLKELDHLIRSMVELVEGDQDFLDGWTHYAKKELAVIQPKLNALYKLCVGKELTVGRVR